MAIVPARDEEDRVGATVAALRSIRPVDEVVVIEDGSRDGTARAARSAGARVLSGRGRSGKGTALERALGRVGESDVYLLADADLGESAGGLVSVLEPVMEGRADLAIAVLPSQPAGGFGLVKRVARWWVERLSGFRAQEPLSGQRAVTAVALAACRPLASGFGLETAMTIDAVRAGLRVVEVPVDLSHRPTGRDLSGFAHRGRQGWDILRAVVPRALRRG